MKSTHRKLTTAEFAKIHGVNKRTLHYYDSIGLFSPESKGENGYRYYNSSQSVTFEYIRMLKELNMSIAEIKNYLTHPNSVDFIKIVDEKTDAIQRQIQQLNNILLTLQTKKQQIELCECTENQHIQIMDCEEKMYLTTPFSFAEEDLPEAFTYAANTWGIEQCRMGIGSYIAVDKVKQGKWEEYDGLFTPVQRREEGKDGMKRGKGKYLCGIQKGTWDKLPQLYQKMLDYGKEHRLMLTGYAFEMGMNDFVIEKEEEYVTQILIPIM